MSGPRRDSGLLKGCGSATVTGLRLRPGMSFDEWQTAGRQITCISSASCWWIGDWVNYGERSYGNRYKRAIEQTPYDYQTLRNYACVARRFDVSRRRDTLSFQHHAEVATLPEAESELWLQRAQSAGWSRNELRRRLTAARDDSESRARAAVLRVELTADRERRWRDAASSNHQELVAWLADVADAAAEQLLQEHAAAASDDAGFAYAVN